MPKDDYGSARNHSMRGGTVLGSSGLRSSAFTSACPRLRCCSGQKQGSEGDVFLATTVAEALWLEANGDRCQSSRRSRGPWTPWNVPVEGSFGTAGHVALLPQVIRAVKVPVIAAVE